MDNSKELENLLEELKENRKSLHNMLGDIESFRTNLNVLLPEKMDFRQKYLLQERMKTVTEIIKGELAVRSQIDSSIKLETDMRRKSTEEDVTDLPLQIKMYAKAIESLEKNREKSDKKMSESLKIVKEG
jgi:GTPase SAR1 family protein